MASSSASSLPYRGRFAPTPSGPLHFGSLIAAVASYLDARAHQGAWLVRIEDIDSPRAVAGADVIILQQLRDHGFSWDDDILYQSQRHERYQQALDQLTASNLTYRCTCSRKQIKARGPYYTGVCRQRQRRTEDSSIRFLNNQPVLEFDDALMGRQDIEAPFASEDFVLYRRDKLYTYQLAVVIDDIDQGITDIVRGADLLTASSWQINLWRQFTERLPRFAHVTLALDANGNKLSKQNHAPALQADQVREQLQAAFRFLGLPEVPSASPVQMLEAATEHWAATHLP
ncbi:hypothetical protein IDSA_09800 [Pseudidiomarina salinarum]|uniref:Glutamyl-Q tRNA(Asp) synthetase n=1 Tax=Pseudidiomarina salinarum TaxID=435908 RepID=A0A094ITB4_9GAMM|nr:tRNA glutamyl-Q(34) synthetase GluQRS [Pseudidiomarina salinarum]KFZ30352.1 hypothetical protein IDSA_09800 [Pseudidiomarina salinarum]RUO68502.1 glutamyl-Q tRNA(Asp) ligase [Pseudidiomarina salinarum]